MRCQGAPEAADLTPTLAAALLFALVLSALLGLATYWLVFRPLRQAPALARVVASLGLFLYLQEVVRLQFPVAGASAVTRFPVLPEGTVHIGPNAVPALAREGYSWSKIVARDVWESATYRGTWRLARRYAKTGAKEVMRSLTGRALVREAQRMLPELRVSDVRRSGAGVRAQAVTRDGKLVDDFLFLRDGRTLHVLNAPSPAATACLVIGERIAEELSADRA